MVNYDNVAYAEQHHFLQCIVQSLACEAVLNIDICQHCETGAISCKAPPHMWVGWLGMKLLYITRGKSKPR